MVHLTTLQARFESTTTRAGPRPRAAFSFGATKAVFSRTPGRRAAGDRSAGTRSRRMASRRLVSLAPLLVSAAGMLHPGRVAAKLGIALSLRWRQHVERDQMI